MHTQFDIEQLISTLKTHRDAVERFLALYDLYKFMTRGRPSVADASRIDDVVQAAADEDRDLNIRAWARYFHERIWGQRPIEPKPHLPKIWQLLIVDDF
jgi:site-specific recombinase